MGTITTEAAATDIEIGTVDDDLLLVDSAFDFCRQLAGDEQGNLEARQVRARDARQAAVDAAWSRYQDEVAQPGRSSRREAVAAARRAYNDAVAVATMLHDAEVMAAREAFLAALESACARYEAAVQLAAAHLAPEPAPLAAEGSLPLLADQRSRGPRPSARRRRLLRHGMHAA